MVRVLLGVVLAALLAAPAHAFDPSYEARNYAKINERATTDYTPEFNAQLATQGAANEQMLASIVAADGPGTLYGRAPNGNLCANAMNGCAGDVRLYDWGEKGYGIVYPVLFTARNGSTLSGHVWMTAKGPKQRPGIVITNGSVQAPESLYWFAAQTLAQSGYVVLTWDPQGQGYSDTFGEGADRNDGVPSQTGRPFYDGTEDALDFFFSTPAKPYKPRPSCTTGTSHVDKQAARVADGRSSGYNPLWRALDPDRVGLVGHSLGAAAVSYIGQLDPRVKAIVAYDNLRDVSQPSSITCDKAPQTRPAKVDITKPALGLSADYGLVPQPNLADPTADTVLDKLAGSLAASKAGVDTGEIVIRGGTHYEFSYIPNPAFGATRRGMDLVAWYTNAWMDRELKNDPSATARLLTTRWRNDALEAEVDLQTPKDGNLFSTYFPSRLDFGGVTCESLRNGCPEMKADGIPGDYSFLTAAQQPDSVKTEGTSTKPAGAPGVPPAASGSAALAEIKKPYSCRPRSKITKVRSKGGSILVTGRASTPAACRQSLLKVVVTVKRKGRGRDSVRATGTKQFTAELAVLRGRYTVQSRAFATDGSAEQRPAAARRVRVR